MGEHEVERDELVAMAEGYHEWTILLHPNGEEFGHTTNVLAPTLFNG